MESDQDLGKTIVLTILYKAEETGHFNKTIDIYSNANGSPLKVKIKGESIL
jgi:hypothetical protein